jgi:hypothetical protein
MASKAMDTRASITATSTVLASPIRLPELIGST